MPDESTSTRFFCRACKSEVVAARVPVRWLSVRRHLADGPRHCGLYCSEACLATWAGGAVELSRI
jgi:hypothetical protein